MIVAMKKIYLVVQKKDAISSLAALRELGVVHIEHEKTPSGDKITSLKEDAGALEKVAGTLKGYAVESPQEELSGWRDKAKIVLDASENIDELREEIRKRHAHVSLLEPWGDFEPDDIKGLGAHGIYMGLYEIPVKNLKDISEEVILRMISKAGSIARCIAVSRREINLPFSQLPLPPFRLSTLLTQQEDDQRKIKEQQRKIEELACYREGFHKVLEEIRLELRFEEALNGMGEAQDLVYLKGFCPVDSCSRLQEAATREQWALLVGEPSDDDKVPTLIRNPKWIELIKPLFAVINIIPGYKELDISLFFLLFFSVFFGMLIGDAAYGLVFLLLTVFAHKKFKDRVKDSTPFFLMYLLSSCAIVWGLMTGTFLGTVLLGKTLKPVVSWLTENKNVQFLCFLIGAIHLTIAHGWRFLMRMRSIFSALAEIGWIVILWGSFFLANVMVIGTPLMGLDFSKSLRIVGVGAILVVIDIISRPKDNIMIGLVLSFFGCISAFTDLVSYIRLFAVGLAGVAVANAFNEMALNIGFSHVVVGFVTALILVVGHLFNMILGTMALFVHGLRLNVLEFSNHLGMEWSGVKYEPFQKAAV